VKDEEDEERATQTGYSVTNNKSPAPPAISTTGAYGPAFSKKSIMLLCQKHEERMLDT